MLFVSVLLLEDEGKMPVEPSDSEVFHSYTVSRVKIDTVTTSLPVMLLTCSVQCNIYPQRL